jgi:hypothetical protein
MSQRIKIPLLLAIIYSSDDTRDYAMALVRIIKNLWFVT